MRRSSACRCSDFDFDIGSGQRLNLWRLVDVAAFCVLVYLSTCGLLAYLLLAHLINIMPNGGCRLRGKLFIYMGLN
jgi:hypothetical protein